MYKDGLIRYFGSDSPLDIADRHVDALASSFARLYLIYGPDRAKRTGLDFDSRLKLGLMHWIVISIVARVHNYMHP